MVMLKYLGIVYVGVMKKQNAERSDRLRNLKEN